jgi:hypothetical protein
LNGSGLLSIAATSSTSSRCAAPVLVARQGLDRRTPQAGFLTSRSTRTAGKQRRARKQSRCRKTE